jgi:NAD(P)H-dependent FMN reductase
MRKSDFAGINVIAMCGSMGENSSTRRVLEVALAGAAETGANVELIELRDYNLPFAGITRDMAQFPDAARLAAKVRAAEGILWGTPEYHGSYSGALKNALDLMGFDEFQGKMIGLVGVAGSSIGAINALTHLRSVGRQLHAWVLPQQVSVARAQDAFTPEGTLKDPDIEKRLTEIGREVARFACLHSTTAEAFLQRWEQATETSGGE